MPCKMAAENRSCTCVVAILRARAQYHDDGRMRSRTWGNVKCSGEVILSVEKMNFLGHDVGLFSSALLAGFSRLLKKGTVPFQRVIFPQQIDTAKRDCPLFQRAARILRENRAGRG